MHYDPQTDFEYHRSYHHDFVNGVKAKPIRHEHIVYRRDGFRITLVTQFSSRPQRMRAQKVAMRANCETHYDFGIYDALDPFGYVFLGHLDDRAIALLIVARSTPFWRFTWEEYYQEKKPKLVSEATKLWTVDFVWVLPRYRGQELANLLLKSASAWTRLSPHKLAWRWPFSESGERFVRRHCPQTFFVT